jgi:uncharacterized protein YndB with AHSA1/START domain
MDRGTYVEHDGRPAVRFQRTYPHPIERVWSAVTEPDELAHWFPSRVQMDPRPGGAIEFSDDPHTAPTAGTVVTCDPPRRLAFTWGGDELIFELEPTGDHGCTLTLTNVLEAPDTAARNAAGWHVCLVELDRHVSGARADGPHSDTAVPWRPWYESYVADGMPSGAPIPG